MTTSRSAFDPFTDDVALASRLMTFATKKRLADVYIGMVVNGRRLYAATDGSIRVRPSCEARDHTIGAGCFAKPVTATLIAAAVAEGKLSWTDCVSDALVACHADTAGLSSVTIRQLLNHTHGLDVSMLERIPCTEAGFIDTQRLCMHLGSAPISPPGELYSYGNGGAWLAAALLENIYDRHCGRLLREMPIAALGSEWAICDAGFCPATGGNLALPISQWLAFLEAHMNQTSWDADLVACLAAMRQDPFPLPGWSPIEQGACLGWKYYGDGWFGHNSNSQATSALLRFNPEQQVAVVLSALGDTVFAAYAALFGELLPELANFAPPRLLKPQERERLQLSRFTGVYTRAHSSIDISLGSANTLLFSTRGRALEHNIPTRALRPAVMDVFIPDPRDSPEFAFIQFLTSPHAAGKYDYLWNGRQLWRRETCR